MIAGAPPVLGKAFAAIGPKATEVFLEHLRGGTSAAWLSDWLKRAGSPVGQTTIKEYRRSLNGSQ